ncbi:MAG: EcsC family protein [Hyphomicrobiales bacterium]|nr:EcsC family protein [Hyphomicrobiales bacterium]MBV8764025.1 EcsC family protein [Hyphomicrobiales bacterium]
MRCRFANLGRQTHLRDCRGAPPRARLCSSGRVLHFKPGETELKVATLEGQIVPSELAAEDLEALRAAVRRLERESLSTRFAQLAGKSAGLFDRILPRAVADAASFATQSALRASLKLALSPSLSRLRDKTGRWHKALATLAGATGGALGLPALVAELPVTTSLLMHAIAEIARDEGEDLSAPEGVLACVEVLALGAGDGAERPGEGYYAAKATLAHSLASLGRYFAERGLVEESAPVFARVMSSVAQRFGVAVSQKFAAQAVPVIGAVAGAAINAAFMSHFQSMAKGHFIVRRLQRLYGSDLIAASYARIKLAEGL